VVALNMLEPLLDAMEETAAAASTQEDACAELLIRIRVPGEITIEYPICRNAIEFFAWR